MVSVNVEILYDQYGKLVYNLALQYVQNSHDAEEITQDVFLSVHHNIGDFNNQATVKTWIYRIAINKSLDHIKSKNRKKRFSYIVSLFFPETNEVRFEKAGFDHPGVMLEQKEALEIIFKGISYLPSNQKTALILSKIENKSQSEIAEIMELSIKSVESLVQRAKKNLKNYLENSKGK